MLVEEGVKRRAPDCELCPRYVWLGDEPLRRQDLKEISNFHCPTWCKGHVVNLGSSYDTSEKLSAEVQLKYYDLQGSKQSADAGLDYVHSLITHFKLSLKTKKQVTKFLNTSSFAHERQPHPCRPS